MSVVGLTCPHPGTGTHRDLPLLASCAPLFCGNAQIGDESYFGGIDTPCDVTGGDKFVINLVGIDIIARGRIQHDGVSFGIVQTMIVFVACCEAVECISVGLHLRLRYILEIGRISHGQE